MLPTDPSLALVAGIFATVGLYAALPGRQATLIAMLGGWAVLPNQVYPAEVIRAGLETQGPIHALAIAAPPWLDKGVAIGLGCLWGAVLFHRQAVLRIRPRWVDLPAAGLALVPLASAAANGRSPFDGLLQALSLAAAWGVPYLLGRVWFADPDGLRAFATGWVWAGLLTLPFAAAEFAAGPFWYDLLYGGHPYRFDGADRWVGHRPLLFTEHGNQFGIWSATAALAAVGLWLSGRGRGWAAALLSAACVAWQSHAAVAFLAVGVVVLLLARRKVGRRWRVAGVGLLAAGLLVGVLTAAAVSRRGAARERVRAVFHGAGKSSFTWRLARVEENLSQIVRRPALGWGVADWSGRSADGTFVDPVALSLWLLVAGQYGLVGAAAVGGVLLLPVARTVAHTPPAPAGLIATLLAVSLADTTMNSILLLPMLLAAGGLAGIGRSSPLSPPAVHPPVVR